MKNGYQMRSDLTVIATLFFLFCSLQILIAQNKLSGPKVPGGNVSGIPVSSGNTVVFRADRETNNVIELWATPADGSTDPIKLSGSIIANGDVFDTPVIDGNTVVFRADRETD